MRQEPGLARVGFALNGRLRRVVTLRAGGRFAGDRASPGGSRGPQFTTPSARESARQSGPPGAKRRHPAKPATRTAVTGA